MRGVNGLQRKSGGWLSAGLWLILAGAAAGQTLRFDAGQELSIPENANVRFGNWFYSDLAFFQSAAYRYVTTRGEGADVLFDEDRGRIRNDGSDFPLVTELSVRNGVLLGKSTELDLSFRLRYRFYPLGSEDNAFEFDMVDLGLYARMGAFSFRLTEDEWLGAFSGTHVQAYGGSRGAGVSANLGFDFVLGPYFAGRLYDQPSYRTDYVDERGLADDFSGEKYTVFQNVAGVDADWLVGKEKNVLLGASRTDTLPQGDRFNEARGVWYRTYAGYYQVINPLCVAGGRADYGWRFYTADDVDRGDQFQQDYTAFTSFDATEFTTIRLSAGFSRAELMDAGAFEEKGSSDTLTGSASIDTRLAEHLSHGAVLSRSQRAGFAAGVEVANEFRYSISWGSEWLSAQAAASARQAKTELARVSDYSDWVASFHVSKPFTETITAHASTAYSLRVNGAMEAGGVDEASLYVTSDYATWVSTLGLSWWLTPRLSWTTYVEHLERFGDVGGLDFSRDAFQTGLSYAYDF
jgi:hypothetical protein